MRVAESQQSFDIEESCFSKNILSLINNRMGRARIDRGPIEVGSKGWDWSMGSIQDPWYAGFHPRAARTRAKRAFSSSFNNKF